MIYGRSPRVLFPLNALTRTHRDNLLEHRLRLFHRLCYFDTSCFLVPFENGGGEIQAGFTIRAFGKINHRSPSHQTSSFSIPGILHK